MAEPYLGEIRMFGFGFAPRNWALCNGQLLPIAQNQALFGLYGTVFGGDGQTTFALPDLRGRVPIHRFKFQRGETGGSTSHTLTLAQLPSHTHSVVADDSPPASPGGQSPTPSRRLSRSEPGSLYGPAASLVAMTPAAVTPVGGGQAHNNLQPSLTISFCVALVGIFPSSN